jgi:hypothetical protein
MRPPAIRYPLFWIAGVIVVGIGIRLARPTLVAVRQAVSQRWQRTTEGPPVPASNQPQTIAGPMVRRVLLLRDGVGAADRPGGRVVETIGRRTFADVYDVWPLTGKPTHYRVGNRRPFGWVEAAEVLPWDTRLVIERGEQAPPSPVVGWEAGRLRAVSWDPERPWQGVLATRTIDLDAVPDGSRGILLSRAELLVLLRRLLAGEPPDRLRVQAIVGDLYRAGDWSGADLAAVESALPDWAFEGRGGPRESVHERLSRINEQWSPRVRWSGIEYAFVPLGALP